jgi:hypothetical protein
MIRKATLILIFAAVWVAVAAGADVSGRWTGSFKMTAPDGQVHDGTALLVLKQAGSDITGTIGPDDGEQHSITKGKIEGDKVTLEAAEGALVMKLEMVLTGERLAGDVTASGEGRQMKAKIDVSRAK